MATPEDSRQELAGLFIAHQSQLRGTAYKIVGTRELAEDITQEAYLKMTEINNIPFDIRQPLAYCVQVVRNLALDHRRRMTLELRVFAHEDAAEHVPTTQGTPEQMAISRQNLRMVDRALNALPVRTRQAFELHRLSGLTQRDVAQKLGVSAALVNAMIRDASDALHCCSEALFSPL